VTLGCSRFSYCLKTKTTLYVLRPNLVGELEWLAADGTTGNIRGADLWHPHRLTLICVVLDAFCRQLDCCL